MNRHNVIEKLNPFTKHYLYISQKFQSAELNYLRSLQYAKYLNNLSLVLK